MKNTACSYRDTRYDPALSLTSGQTVAPHPFSPPAQRRKEGETTFCGRACHLPIMVSPGPNRSPGAGLLHTTEDDSEDWASTAARSRLGAPVIDVTRKRETKRRQYIYVRFTTKKRETKKKTSQALPALVWLDRPTKKA